MKFKITQRITQKSQGQFEVFYSLYVNIGGPSWTFVGNYSSPDAAKVGAKQYFTLTQNAADEEFELSHEVQNI